MCLRDCLTTKLFQNQFLFSCFFVWIIKIFGAQIKPLDGAAFHDILVFATQPVIMIYNIMSFEDLAHMIIEGFKISDY